MRIQYISDIHLEHYDIHSEKQLNPTRWIEPDPSAEVLILAGDIGNPRMNSYTLFLDWCSKNWPQVILIAGNHEFYKAHSPEEVVQNISSITSRYSNVHFLDRELYELRPGLCILGCTLWTTIPDDMKKYAETGIADFRWIKGMWSAHDYNLCHKRDLDWLSNTLTELHAKGVATIVVTHHMPTPSLIAEKYRDTPLNCCFAVDLDALIKEFIPVAWICGHSHTGNTMEIVGQNGAKTILTLNPHGYKGERVETRNLRAILDIDI